MKLLDTWVVVDIDFGGVDEAIHIRAGAFLSKEAVEPHLGGMP